MGILVCRKNVVFCSSFSHFLLSMLLLFSLFFVRFTHVLGSNCTKCRKVGNLRLERIQKHIEQINKPPVISIQSPDGDIIDCVHREKQPAFDHPLLKNHKIQIVPPEMPKVNMDEEKEGNLNKEYNKEGVKVLEWQMWHLNGTRCPKGTVPIRRSKVDDVLRAKSLFDFGKKPPRSLPLARRFDNAPHVGGAYGHEHAVAYTGLSEQIYGAAAKINVWDPSLEETNEFSLSQIWVLSGEFDGSNLNSVEAGWQVSPELYGDSRSRLFTYWTSDFYQSTGCYNLLCAGFVQMNSRVAIGAAISPLSSLSSSQYHINILIWKDPRVGNWWMSCEGILVGYWPMELFTHLASHATTVEWGGEVFNTWPNGVHTSTQMGSGQFAENGFEKASYFRNLQTVGWNNRLHTPQNIQVFAENPRCYDIKNSYSYYWGQHFYYGGPGRNHNCP